MPLNQVLRNCKKILSDYYGPRFQGLILYGSSAHRKTREESDIDLLILLKRPVNYFKELRRLTELLYPLQLDCKQLISAKPADAVAFKKGQIQLYRNAKREGWFV